MDFMRTRKSVNMPSGVRRVGYPEQYIMEDIEENHELVMAIQALKALSKIDSENSVEKIRKIKEITLYFISFLNEKYKGILNTDEDNDENRKKILSIIEAELNHCKVYDGDSVFNLIIDGFSKYVWGYYILDDYINDSSISDVRVLDWNYIRYKRYGKREKAPISFCDKEDYISFVKQLAVKNKINLSDINAVQNFTDKSNSKFILRFEILTEFVNSDEVPILIIRKVAKEKKDFEELINDGMLSQGLADFFSYAAKKAKGIIFTGKGASGKTTLMNAFLEQIDDEKSGVVIQESEELFINKKISREGETIPAKDICFLHTVGMSGEGKIEYTLTELARTGLRMDLDYYIIGEIKGDEASGFSLASFTGHQCWASVHGMNSLEGINKLADYIKQATTYSFEDCLKKLIGMELVIFMKGYKVSEITRIYGFDEKHHDLIKKVIFYDGKWVNLNKKYDFNSGTWIQEYFQEPKEDDYETIRLGDDADDNWWVK